MTLQIDDEERKLFEPFLRLLFKRHPYWKILTIEQMFDLWIAESMIEATEMLLKDNTTDGAANDLIEMQKLYPEKKA